MMSQEIESAEEMKLGQQLDKTQVDWESYAAQGVFTPILYAASTGGLGNRLLGISACAAKVAAERRRLKVYWPLNGEDGLGARWDELFESPLAEFTDWDFYWVMDVMHRVKWYNSIKDLDPAAVDKEEIVVVKSSYLPHRTDPAARAWLRGLQVRAAILEAVAKTAIPKNTLGVHLRKRDAEPRLEPVVFPEEPVTPEVLEVVAAWPGQVLAVSNSESAKLGLAARFGSKIIFRSNSFVQRDAAGVKAALVDAIRLSQCERIFGHGCSTLFQLAEIWGGKFGGGPAASS